MADQPQSGDEAKPGPETAQNAADHDNASGPRRFGADTWPEADLPAGEGDEAEIAAAATDADADANGDGHQRGAGRPRTPRPTPVSTRARRRAQDEVVERLDVAEAERIEVSRGSVGRAHAHSLVVTQGAVGGVQADEVQVSRGLIGGVRARSVSLHQGGMGGAIAGEVNVRLGYVNGIVARDVRLEQAGARMIVANEVTLGPQSGAFIVLGRRVNGAGRAILDWRGALAFGAGFGAILALLRRRR